MSHTTRRAGRGSPPHVRLSKKFVFRRRPETPKKGKG
jgi:hypothetical protein